MRTATTTERLSGIKLDFQEFSGEPEEWNTWSKIYLAQISALGCEDVLTIPTEDDVGVEAENFDGSQVHPETLRKFKEV